MNFNGLYLHPVTILITVVELTILIQQLLTYFSRPDEDKRLWQIILLALVMLLNIVEGLLDTPIPSINIPISLQLFLGQFFGYIVGAYFPIYWYKTLDFKNLKLHAKYGPFFILLPTIVIFILFSALTPNIKDLKLYIYICPITYMFFLMGRVLYNIYKQYRSDKNKDNTIEHLIVFSAILPYIGIPIMNIFAQQPKWVVEIVMNGGILLSNVFFIRQIVNKSRKEHYELIDLNNTLLSKVKERTLQLERINEERVNAFVNIIHETKTPLTLIKNHLEGFSKKYKNTSELTIITRNINRLSNNINNLFDTERFIKGSEVYDHQQVTNFTQLLQDNIAFFRPLFEAKQINFIENIEDNVFVQADPNAINSIVNNLLENAIKFTSEDESVHVLLETIEGKDEVLFSVRDSGVGIPKELHKKIFEPYYQINTEKKNSQGMGLGLPIVKKIMDSLNGQILVFSNPEYDKGTSMMSFFKKYTLLDAPITVSKFVVPQNNSLDTSEFSIAPKPHNSKKMSILVVEDKHDLVKYLHQRFSGDYNVEYALNGSEALKKLNSLSFFPNIIISDIMMDVMDGFQFMKVLYKMNDFKHIPVIFLSAKTAQMDRLKALRMGVVDFVQKPFSFDELALKVESVLENKKNQEQATYNAIFQNLKSKERSSLPLYENIEEIAIKQCKIFRITEAEFEVAKLVREGLTSPGIAEKIHRAESTINKQIENMFKKTSVNKRSELVKKIWPSPLSN